MPLRVLYVAAGMPIPGAHGGSVHALELCRGLVALGHEVHLLGQPPEAEHEPLDGLHVHTLPGLIRAQLEWTLASSVVRLARAIEPDIIVERFYTFGGTGARAARVLDLPLVLEINSPARAYPGSLRDQLDRLTVVRPVDRWRQRVLDTASAYYGSSPVLVEERRRERFSVIPNGGVDTERIVPGSPIPDAGPLELVHVSSFRAWHGAEDLVVAVNAAVAAGADLRLTCVGSGPREAAAREVARKGASADRFRFVGSVDHGAIPAILAAAHVGVAPFNPDLHSALQLGWYWSPIKIYEYLAAGLPVVTADIEALRGELPGAVGHFYPPGDTPALTTLLGQLASDRPGLRAAASRARALAEQRYTWARHAESLSTLLKATLRP